MEITVIEVSEDYLEELRQDSDMLRCLENAGVDNWEGYEDALAEWRTMPRSSLTGDD